MRDQLQQELQTTVRSFEFERSQFRKREAEQVFDRIV